MPLPLTRDLLTQVSLLDPKRRRRALRSIGKDEWAKCGKDVFYWLDAAQHADIPYVYTWDPHPMYACKECKDGNAYKFSGLDRHLTIRHHLEGLEEPIIRQHFTELPTNRPFTLHDYMRPIIREWLRYPLFAIEKSRDMMATWLIVTLFAWDTFFHPGRQNIFQSNDAAKTCELVERAWHIYQHQPKFLKPYKAQFGQGTSRSGELYILGFNSEILGFPQGPDQIRQFHPTGVFQDEAAYQVLAGAAFAALKPSIQNGGRCTMVSSANPGFFMHVCRDSIDTIIEG